MCCQMLAAIILAVIFPLIAVAAQGNEPVTPSFFLPALLAGIVLLAGLCWLWVRYCRLRQQYDALLARAQLAEDTIDRAPFPIVRFDDTKTIVAANQVACQDHAISPVGREFAALYPHLREHADVPSISSASGHDEPLDTEGKLVVVEFGGQRQTVWYGLPVSAVGIPPATTDVESLAEASANRMKSEFIANINHEVRTPMNAIIGYAEMLANAELGSKEKRFVAIIHKSSMALVSIFNDIMELSKIDSGRLHIFASTVRLRAIISEVESLFKDLADEKGIQLICSTVEHLPESYIFDGVRFKQVLQNLISNAIKFTHDGVVTLQADGEPSTAKPGCYDLRFVVEDTGIGIQEPDLEKIFDLFQQGEEVITKQYGGVGLGLTLCSRLVAMMGGRIDLNSVVGQGTRFTVHLPGVPVAAKDSFSRKHETLENQQDGNRKLLVVDDVDLIKDVFLDFFQGTPYTVLTAKNGEEALAIARTERPALVFMDLNLSGMDGRSVTQQLRQDPMTASIPVVVMTGEMLEEAEYLPLFNGYLQKPFRLDALKEMVATYLNGRPLACTVPQECAGSDENTPFSSAQVAALWNDSLEELLRQALYSGSLTDATALGTAMLQLGKSAQQPVLSNLGEELLLHAQEPNILGVDRLLAQLSRINTDKRP
jgi:signal transduction histidine kinase/CheY-like chemotaxis protein